MNKEVEIGALYGSIPPYLKGLFEGARYPWEILPRLSEYVAELLREKPEGYTEWKDGVLIGKNVRMGEHVTIIPPAILGEGCELRTGAFLRGQVVIGAHCVIGNSSEIKHSILMDHVQVPHYNYVGDSILGQGVHMGAGAICSNLKSGGSDVTVHGERDYPTGLRKVGSFLGDGADIGCGCVLNPGTVIGKGTSVYPLTALRGVYPAASIVKAADDICPRTVRI